MVALLVQELRQQLVPRRSGRFFQVLGGMSLLVGFLALLEMSVLCWMGIGYESPTSLRAVDVDQFSLSSDGRWGAVRLNLIRAGTFEQPREIAIRVYDMESRECVACLETGAMGIHRVAISPQGNLLAFTTSEGEVYLTNLLRGSEPHRILTTIGHEKLDRLVWSPDAQWLAVAGFESLYLLAIPSGELRFQFPHGCRRAPAPWISADSGTLVAVGDPDIRRWDLTSGTEIGHVSATATPLSGTESAALTSDGKLVLVSSTDQGLLARTVPAGDELWRNVPSKLRPVAMAVSPGDALVATVEGRLRRGPRWQAVHSYDRIMVRSVLTGALLFELEPDVGRVAGMLFAPDGTLCVWGSRGVIVGCGLPSGHEKWRLDCREAISGEESLSPAGLGSYRVTE
jgi:WD40 repeat protein